MRKTKKKILVFDQGEFLGGAELFLSDVLKKLNKRKYEVTLVHDGGKEYIAQFKRTKIKLIKHPLPRISRHLKKLSLYGRTVLSLRKLIKSQKPDLIITNTVRTHIYVTPIAKHLKIKQLWFLHDFTFHAKRLLKLLVRHPSAIITCSKAVKSWLVENTSNAHSEKVFPIPTFATTPKDFKKHQCVRKKNDLIMIGNFTKWKGHHIFIEAMQKVVRKFPGVKAMVIGKLYKGKKESVEYLAELYQQVTDLKINRSIKIIEDEENVMSQIARSKVLVHCSTQAEPMGRVILEGMTAGAVVISTTQGGPPTIIDHEETGYLIKPNDPEELADTIIELLSSQLQLKNVRAEAAKEIHDHYFWKEKIKSIESVIDSVF